MFDDQACCNRSHNSHTIDLFQQAFTSNCLVTHLTDTRDPGYLQFAMLDLGLSINNGTCLHPKMIFVVAGTWNEILRTLKLSCIVHKQPCIVYSVYIHVCLLMQYMHTHSYEHTHKYIIMQRYSPMMSKVSVVGWILIVPSVM